MIKVYKETEKAVQMGMMIENTISDKEFVELIWVPKSQLNEKGSPSMWILGKKIEERFGYNGRNGYQFVGLEMA